MRIFQVGCSRVFVASLLCSLSRLSRRIQHLPRRKSPPPTQALPGRPRNVFLLLLPHRSTRSWTAWSRESISSWPRCATCIPWSRPTSRISRPTRMEMPHPVKDQYFLGRLDMSDGPEDTSFVGQPGFGHRMLNRLTCGLLHALPASGVRADGRARHRFPEKVLQLYFCAPRVSRRSALPGHRCSSPRKTPAPAASWEESGSRIRTTTWFASTELILPTPTTSFYLHFDSWRLNMRSGDLAARLHLQRGVGPEISRHQESCISGRRPVFGDTT